MEKISEGAEACVFRENERIHKVRGKKSYRIQEIDRMIRKGRTKAEASIMKKIEHLSISPKLLENQAKEEYTVVMEEIKGVPLSSLISESIFPDLIEKAAETIGILHREGVVHGDLTLNNLLFRDKIFLIDFGLSRVSQKDEDRAVDLYLFERAIKASSGRDLSKEMEAGYKRTGSLSAIDRLQTVRKRGRKRELQAVG